ncbi:hypothetical protein [Neisseria weixii]|uniref:hypothetical protein n=1 Tax=Neisseria weixii TaxID=1853276 RepID=UPI00359F1A93
MTNLFKVLRQIQKENDTARREFRRELRTLPVLWFISLLVCFCSGMTGFVYTAIANKSSKNLQVKTVHYQNIEFARVVATGRNHTNIELEVQLPDRFIRTICTDSSQLLCDLQASKFFKDKETLLTAEKLELQTWYRLKQITRIDYKLNDSLYTFIAPPIEPDSEIRGWRQLAEFWLWIAALSGLLWLIFTYLWRYRK